MKKRFIYIACLSNDPVADRWNRERIRQDMSLGAIIKKLNTVCLRQTAGLHAGLVLMLGCVLSAGSADAARAESMPTNSTVRTSSGRNIDPTSPSVQKGGAGKAVPFHRSADKKQIKKTPTAEQKSAAQEARQTGVKVSWNDKRGVPASVRGKGLGSRKSFSGGKGLAARVAATDDQKALAVMDNLSRIYGFKDVEKEFKHKQTKVDHLGLRHVRMNQMHQGLRVVGAELVV
ncbi:MAG: hypothetical protein FJ220_04150, partial [Kiritimatiellaceae bacterium]|nr:hypothetical protein [Kiritimatiellaceae bacterium]